MSAETVSQRAMDAAADTYVADHPKREETALTHSIRSGGLNRNSRVQAFARFERELSANKDETIAGEMPTIWEDPAGKGYPCFERPMTPAEAKAALAAADARNIEKDETIRKLRDALKPFADCCAQISDNESDEEWAKFRLLIKDYRRARQVLTSTKKDG